MAANPGTEYEIIVRSIFDHFVNQGEVENVAVQHDVEVEGSKTYHQIDIYWEFRRGGITYRTVVQAKNWQKAVSKGEVLKLRAVLDDIPGQPRGVIVTRTGLQRGAHDLAKKHGIVIYQIAEQVKEKNIVPVGSIVQFVLLKIEHPEAGLMGLDMLMMIHEADVSGITVHVDLEEKDRALDSRLDEIRRESNAKPLQDYLFQDEDGMTVLDLKAEVARLLTKMVADGSSKEDLLVAFGGPTFLRFNGSELGPFRVRNVGGTVERRMTTRRSPMNVEGIARYVVRNITDNREDVVVVKQSPTPLGNGGGLG